MPFPFPLDFSDDFLIAADEEVSLLRQLSSAEYEDPVEEIPALREPKGWKTVAVLMEAADVVFHLHAPTVGPRGIHTDDRILDGAGVLWNVKGATLAGYNDQWRVPCIAVPSGPS